MPYKIPLFDLNFGQEEEEAVLDVIRSRWISAGPKTQEFENNFKNLLNSKHALAVSNCTVALHLALKLVGVREGDEVICPSLTFVATCNSIKYLNAIPVFADIKSLEEPLINELEIENKITSKTKAIIVMHYAGFPCNMDKIMALARKYNIKVIEDACHAPLSEYKGEKLGTIGDIGCFSFFSNKNISTGEGGMLITNNSEYFEKAKLLRSHGMTTMSFERAKGHSTAYDVVDLGFNYRIDDIRSSIGVVQLRNLKKDLTQRKKVRSIYIKKLTSIKNIIIPFEHHDELSSNYVFPIVIKNINAEKRNNLRDLLAKKGIQTSVHYPAVHKFSIYKEFYSELPFTDQYEQQMITLPMYSRLKESEISYIAKELKSLL
ncbi:MAG: aminotransferase DegT [Flavobacteriales bacterium]|nr:aminotransferase DegT [Flavobacteriales bacterium]|tara:strand:+ start:1645 stop:2772 length:1128 start_codon:yes stop_codon:yes gene_type:complete